jgi:hypothetical protein
MSCLPRKQLSKSQRGAVELQIEPDTKIVQGHFRGQASLKAGHIMRAFASQAEGVQQLVVDGLDDLSDVDPNLWRPQRGDLAHQLFVHEGTHVLQG